MIQQPKGFKAENLSRAQKFLLFRIINFQHDMNIQNNSHVYNQICSLSPTSLIFSPTAVFQDFSVIISLRETQF